MNKEDSVIKKLQAELHSRTKRSFHRDRRDLKPDEHTAPQEWLFEDEVKEAPKRQTSSYPTATLVLIGAIVFFLFSAAISAMLFFGGGNTVSARNIDIEIAGPITIAGGQELVLQIGIVNRNSVPLELADLIVEYPDGSRTPGDMSVPLPRTREGLGTVPSGNRIQKTGRAILFGEAQESKRVLITLEYRIQGSNAIFVKEAEHEVVLSSSPLSVKIDALKEIISGQEVAFTATITSNSSQPIQDALLVVEYPQGFDFISASPSPAFNSRVWELGTILPNQTREITIRGLVLGQDQEERIVRFNTGVASERNPEELAAVFAASDVSFFITRPFISLDIAVNGERGVNDVVISGGSQVRVDMTWTNNLSNRLQDGEIVVDLKGAAYDRRSVATSNGFYDSNTETIRFTRETLPELGVIDPGRSGSIGFSFTALPTQESGSLGNPEIGITARIQARRVTEVAVPETIESIASRTLLLSTDLALRSKTLYSTGAFVNTGPVPPRAEQKTTYTIVWSVENSIHNLDNVRIVASLPSYVTWVGTVSPADSGVSFNPVGGRVLWDVGSVPRGSGITGAPREVSFQVSVTPSLSQIDTSPVLVGSQTITGLDRFTNKELQSTAPALTTDLSGDDPQGGRGSGRVGP